MSKVVVVEFFMGSRWSLFSFLFFAVFCFTLTLLIMARGGEQHERRSSSSSGRFVPPRRESGERSKKGFGFFVCFLLSF